MEDTKYWIYMSEIWSYEALVQNFINFMPETKVHDQCASVLGYDRYWMYHYGSENVF